MKESVKSVIHIPTDLNEITASTAKPNDIPNNSSGNNCDSEEIKESPVSMNSDSTKCKQNGTSLNRNGYAHDSQCAVGSVPTCCSFSVRRRLKISLLYLLSSQKSPLLATCPTISKSYTL
ncbi:Inorganic pyrophosphatase [Trichinella spiralis]|uniref:Inorganic pyrophosphatase n=1 Tax=Trichinella spiralis TaxID=6334 RepID=A0ABR3KQC9_TRISP